MNHTQTHYVRRLAVGAEVAGPDAVSFRVWAPAHEHVTVVLEASEGAREFALDGDGTGYFSGTRVHTRAGMLYRLRLDEDSCLHPDPASRFQPQGHDGPTEIVDPSRYAWRDASWRGATPAGQVLYEMHIGTFTQEGTWRAAAAQLPFLAELGVTALSLLPVGEFPGEYGWGYDVVHFFAPTRLYGTPDDMRAFVDAAHALGLAVILDVIYNHCGTIGCVLSAFTADYLSRQYRNDWGHALNFDGENAAGVREFVIANAEYWIHEFHMDGYRLDATQAIFDASPVHIVAEVTARARAAAGARALYIIGENEPQQVRLIESPERGGYGVDALWNDDFHHAARVALTGRSEAYYTDYRGSPQEFVSGAKRGFLYQGQYYSWQKQGRGSPAGHFEPARFVNFLENHDQVANSTRGQRLHELTTPGRWRAATALLLLAPQTPMLFQGQEFAASTPFLYFADHDAKNADQARAGRRAFLEQFATIAAGGHACLTDPVARETFERCKLDVSERRSHTAAVVLHRDLIRLRRRDPVFSAQNVHEVDGAVLGAEAFVLRFFSERGDDRLLIVNFGAALALTPIPEPLLAPPVAATWKLAWSSEDVAYGGDGTAVPHKEGVWNIPAHAALLMRAER
ncbi:MAG TPA: malto-oligosyltrehalose trehalohydrolase [Burkholderiales bacterium]|nr:malto-oligosyltrehalose trehalohydrolase [Burkholderiales bacterium]